MDDRESIRTDEIRKIAVVLDGMGAAYAALATWLESKNIHEITGGGTPTAKRGLQYLGGFTGTVLKAFSASQLGDDDAPHEIASNLLRTEAAAKSAAKPRPETLSHEDAYAKHVGGKDVDRRKAKK